MFECLLLGAILADAAGAFTAIYWGCLIVGGGLLLISALGGGHHDADVDVGSGFDVDHAHGDFDADAAHVGHADVDAGIAHAAHGGAAALTTWFSLRFVVFFVAMFGAIGAVLHHLTDLGAWTALCVALAVGLVSGQAVHQVFRYIRRTSGNSTTHPQDYVFKLGRVTVMIDGAHNGEVALHVRGGERFVPAVCGGATQHFGVGDEVVVVGYRAGVAQVVSRSEFEQQREGR